MAGARDEAREQESAAGGSEPGTSGGSEPQLRAQFEKAAGHLTRLATAGLRREDLLYMYSRYKQITCGKCDLPKPSFFDFESRQKWKAWKELGDKTVQQAMQEYIAAVKEMDPEWNPQDSQDECEHVLFGGPVVSSLYQEENIRDEDKTIFDHCIENNIDRVCKAITSKNVDINQKDEEGRALLHWACDRGHKDLVTMLLEQKAEINIQDSEGQTALHYASACEFADIVELLLNSGADPTIQDREGCLPEEVTDSKLISQMLQHHEAPKA